MSLLAPHYWDHFTGETSLPIFPCKFFELHTELEQLVRRDLEQWFSEDERIELLTELGHKNVQNLAMLSKSSSRCIIYDQKKM